MHIFLSIFSVLAFLAGLGVLIGATGAIHEIEGFVLMLISSVLLVGAAIVDAIRYARERLEWVVQSGTGATKQAPTSKVGPLAPPVIPPPPNPKPAKHAAYFVSLDGRDSGPHSLDDLKRLRQAGSVSEDTLAFREGDSEWRPLSQFAEIQT